MNTHPGLRIEPAALLNGLQTPEKAAQTLMAMIEREPIIYSTAKPEEILAVQAAQGQDAAAGAIEKFFAKLAVLLAEAGVDRFIVGGGETSGAIVSALGVSELAIGPQIDPGVPAMTTQRGGKLLGLVLKSGNFGAADFYRKAMAIAAGQLPIEHLILRISRCHSRAACNAGKSIICRPASQSPYRVTHEQNRTLSNACRRKHGERDSLGSAPAWLVAPRFPAAACRTPARAAWLVRVAVFIRPSAAGYRPDAS